MRIIWVAIIGIIILLYLYFTKSECFENQTQSIKKDIQITLYHAPWCGHCKHFMPEWNKFVALNLPVTVTDITCEGDYEEMCTQKVKGYPTILITHSDGVETTYEGTRDAESLKKYVETYL